MTDKIIPTDIKSKTIKEAKEEINKILEKIEKDNANLESFTNDYDRLLKLNKHIDELFKKKLREINSQGKKNLSPIRMRHFHWKTVFFQVFG